MSLEDWKYYNHAMVSTVAPHEVPDTSCISDGTIWKQNKKALFARWTTDFDCGYETDWWYIIKDNKFDMENELDSKKRKHIKQALNKVEVRLINPEDYAEELAYVFNKTCDSYKNYNCHVSPENFKTKEEYEYWAGFCKETNKLIGYMMCKRYGNYVDTVTAKYDPEYLSRGCSAAIHYEILNYYLNKLGYKYINSGERNISHETNIHTYKISKFAFKKAYCVLHIEYNPKIKPLIKILFPFRKILKKLNNIHIIKNISSILLMEEIVRKRKNKRIY